MLSLATCLQKFPVVPDIAGLHLRYQPYAYNLFQYYFNRVSLVPVFTAT